MQEIYRIKTQPLAQAEKIQNNHVNGGIASVGIRGGWNI